MKKVLLFAWFGCLLAMPIPAVAEVPVLEPMVVTATRIETALAAVGSSMTVISRQEIENRQAVQLADLLRGVPGLDVVRQGGPGQTASVFLRGANSAHTLVLVDGVELNDPSTPARFFDFAAMPLDNIERIEILRGPGSTLYGSDAIGGVINIITRRGAGAPSGSLDIEAGSFSTHQEKFSLRGGGEKFNYSLAGSFFSTDGVSAASEDDGNSEEDGHDRTSLATRLGLTPNKNLEVDLLYRYLDAETDLDNFGGAFGDDPNNLYDARSDYVRVQAQWDLFDRFWEQILGVSLTDYDRTNRNGTDAAHPVASVDSRFEGRLWKADWQNNLALSEVNTLILGIEHEEESAESRDFRTFEDFFTGEPTSALTEFDGKSARTTGYFLENQWLPTESTILTGGVRFDDHSRFGSHGTWRLTGSHLVSATGTRLKVSYGTGFKAPSLYQLFSRFGDLDLDPETSRGWDAGLTQTLFDDRLSLGMTYFQNEFEDLIDFDFSSNAFQNIGEASSRGVELTMQTTPTDALEVAATYTYTETEDEMTGDQLLRRPRNKGSVTVNYQWPNRAVCNLEILYVGEREDLVFPDVVTLDSYTLVNLSAVLPLTGYLKLTGRVENLFDENYEEVSGYGTPGLAGYLGAKLTF
ncbi:MAG TPA: TonB-dependent receptor [Desulfuromonadales bacterium]|nr:TonB-dependent receptor [Desulfuromonadales bacterium]